MVKNKQKYHARIWRLSALQTLILDVIGRPLTSIPDEKNSQPIWALIPIFNFQNLLTSSVAVRGLMTVTSRFA